MKRAPLKISWRSWCLYKLAKRDFSVNEMAAAIRKRASEADQTVDPSPVVDGLISEGLLDDDRLVRNAVQLQFDVYRGKGPVALKRDFETKKKIPADIVDCYLEPDDERWGQIAEELCRKSIRDRLDDERYEGEIPRKVYEATRRGLVRKGFTRSQIDQAMRPYRPVTEPKPTPSSDGVMKLVERRMDLGKGPKDIQHHLRQLRVEEDVIQACLDIPDEVWIEIATREKQKKFGMTAPRTQKEKRRQIDFLLRRGFLYEHVDKAIRSLE